MMKSFLIKEKIYKLLYLYTIIYDLVTTSDFISHASLRKAAKNEPVIVLLNTFT